MPVFLHQSDPEFFRDKQASDYVVKKLTKKYSKTGAFAKTIRDDAKFNLFIGLLDQLESELTKFQTYYTEYSMGALEEAPSTRRLKRSSKPKNIQEVKNDIGLGSIVGLVKRVSRLLDSYPTFNSLNPRDIDTLTKSYQDLMVFISGFQDLTDSSDEYNKKLAKAKDDLENWDTLYPYPEDELEERSERERLTQFVRDAVERQPQPLRIQGVANAFYADLYNFLVAFRTKLNIYETDPENKTPHFGASDSGIGGDSGTGGGGDSSDDDGDDGENHGFDALDQEGLSSLSSTSILHDPRSSSTDPESEDYLRQRLGRKVVPTRLTNDTVSDYGSLISLSDIGFQEPKWSDPLLPKWAGVVPPLRFSGFESAETEGDEIPHLFPIRSQSEGALYKPVRRTVPKSRNVRQFKGRYDEEKTPPKPRPAPSRRKKYDDDI